MKFIFPFSGSRLGGSNFSSLILIKSLIKNNYQVKILLHKKGHFSKYLDDNNIKYELLNIANFDSSYSLSKNILILFKFFFIALKYLRSNKGSLIHFNEYRISFTWILPLLFFNNKIIIHARNIFFKSLFLNIICRRTDKIVVISNYVAKSFPLIFNDKIVKINNPIIISNDNKQINFFEKFQLSNKKKIITYISNFKDKKRPILFIEIANKILDIRSDCHFFMFGDYDNLYEKKIKDKIKELNLINSLSYFKFQNDINSIISSSDLIVLTGINEGQGRVALEAFSNKTIVVASDSGGYKDIIKNNYNGFLCKPDNSDHFTKTIDYVLNNFQKINNEIKFNGYNLVKNEFSQKKHFEEIINMYSSVIDECKK